MSHLRTSLNISTTFVLTVLVLLSAIGVISSKHASRGQFTLLGKYQKEMDKLNLEWSQLLLEQATLGGGGRVESIATDKLGMKAPNDNDIQMLP